MFRPIANVDSNNTTFNYFSDHLSVYYRTAKSRDPLKYVDSAGENYFPLVLTKYENKPIDGIQLLSKIELLSTDTQKILLIKE